MSGLVLVVPAADDRPGTHRLLALAEALADEPGIDLTSLLWAGGPLAPAFADLSPTIDADAVNTWGPAQALARARLTPAARLAKNRRLRSLLAPLAETRAVLVGGLAAMTAVGWLPPARTAVIVRAADVHPTPALTEADLVVAADVEAERWLTGKAEVPEDRVRRHALLEGPEPSATRADRIGLVGWDAEDVGRIVAGRTAAAGEPAAATWFVDEREAWGLWQGPTATPL
ncbi:MAG TPA: hypothetical protein VD926_04780, partial [Acidimicrobiales bacterium]|nr:hypothetical protein [Acidimicrobiales bacterium]